MSQASGIKTPNIVEQYSGFRFVVISIGAVFVLFLSATNIMAYFYKKGLPLTRTSNPSSSSLSEKAFWLNEVINNPNYADGWLKIATIEWQIGNKPEAKSDYLRAKEINPENPSLKKVETLFAK